ncbi:unnamed protein product [Moneuplotes crassus]|uniref:Uncharacterized protein n=1 Tax=Euplotes crassus TaxID=5936 RepID=A0AAD2D2I8_EUPCR|nr:unnamed protein product [Moneuplotes crassus]
MLGRRVLQERVRLVRYFSQKPNEAQKAARRVDRAKPRSQTLKQNTTPKERRTYLWYYGLAAVSFIGVLKASSKVTEALLLVSDELKSTSPKIKEIYDCKNESYIIEMEQSEIVHKDVLLQNKFPIIKAGVDHAFEENCRIISSIPNPALLCSPFIAFSTVGMGLHLLAFIRGRGPRTRWIQMAMWLLIYATLNVTAVSMITLRSWLSKDIQSFVEYIRVTARVCTPEQIDETTDVTKLEPMLLDYSKLSRMDKIKLKIANIF